MQLKLGRDVETDEPVTLDGEPRTQGLYVVGLQGTGKSTLLLNLIHQDMEAGHGLCLLDPHGDLVRDVLARVPGFRQQDVIYLNPLDYEHPFGLNLFECQDPEDMISSVEAQERILHVFEKVWYPEGDMMDSAPQLTEVLSNLSYLLISNQGYTMAEIPLILSNDVFRGRLVKNITNPRVRQWWESVYSYMPPEDRALYASSTMRRMERFLQNPILYNIVAQSHTTVDFRAVMDEGKILIISLPRVRIGSEAVTLLGSIFISQLLTAALSRDDTPTHERKFFALYADEYWRFAISDFASLLAEVRKYNVATTIAHQWLAQLDRDNQSAVKSTVNKVVFQVSPDDAHEFSKGFYHDPSNSEIIGYKPIQIVAPFPLDELSRSGHTNPQMAELWPILDRHLRAVRTGERRRELSVNRYLLEVMERRIPLSREEELAHLLNTITEHVSGLAYQTQPKAGPASLGSIEDDSAHLSSLLERAVAWSIDQARDCDTKGDPWIELTDFLLNGRRGAYLPELPDHSFDRQIVFNKVFQALKVRLRDICLNPNVSTDEDVASEIERIVGPEPQRSNYFYYNSRVDTEAIIKALDRRYKSVLSDVKTTRLYIPTILAIADILRLEPIMTSSSQFEPIYERPRSFSDVQAEVASALAHTPIRRARCRIIRDLIVVEHTISTDPPPATTFRFTPSPQGTPRAKVEEQIRQRQQGHQLPPTPQRARRFGNR
jgi:hypothetical protein